MSYGKKLEGLIQKTKACNQMECLNPSWIPNWTKQTNTQTHIQAYIYTDTYVREKGERKKADVAKF